MKLIKEISLARIAEMINAKYEGPVDTMIAGINEIHMVEPGDITFVDHPKYYEKALNSKATTIIINKQIPSPNGKALIFSDDPFKDYVYLVQQFRKFEKSSQNISETAEIGEGTVIQPGVFIGHHVKIGKNCIIHANVSIYDHSIIGNNVIIHANSVIGSDAYYFKRRPEYLDKLESCGSVVIEDDVEIGALCSIDIGVSGETRIGKGTKFDNHVQVGHDSYIGKNCLIGAQCAIAGVTRIEDEVILWSRVAVNKDLVIGKRAVVLATSAVDKSLEGGKQYFGTPAVEAYQRWREMAALRKLPEFFKKM